MVSKSKGTCVKTVAYEISPSPLSLGAFLGNATESAIESEGGIKEQGQGTPQPPMMVSNIPSQIRDLMYKSFIYIRFIGQ